MSNITDEMIKAGEDIAGTMYEATVAKAFGGPKTVPDSVENYDIINKYLNEEIVSCTGIYMAMERAREKK